MTSAVHEGERRRFCERDTPASLDGLRAADAKSEEAPRRSKRAARPVDPSREVKVSVLADDDEFSALVTASADAPVRISAASSLHML